MLYMEQQAQETPSAGAREAGDNMTDVAVFDLESYVNVELDMKEDNRSGTKVGHKVSATSQGLCHALSCWYRAFFFFFFFFFFLTLFSSYGEIMFR